VNIVDLIFMLLSITTIIFLLKHKKIRITKNIEIFVMILSGVFISKLIYFYGPNELNYDVIPSIFCYISTYVIVIFYVSCVLMNGCYHNNKLIRSKSTGKIFKISYCSHGTYYLKEVGFDMEGNILDVGYCCKTVNNNKIENEYEAFDKYEELFI
jgi:hypothetical protein